MRSFLALLSLLVAASCSSPKRLFSPTPILIMVSEERNLEIVSYFIYLSPVADSISSIEVNGIKYSYTFLYYGRDGFNYIPCCQFKTVANLSVDTQKIIEKLTPSEIDSLNANYLSVQKQVTRQIQAFQVKKKSTLTLEVETREYSVFKTNNLTYCDCLVKAIKPNVKEGFITKFGNVKSLTNKEKQAIDDDLLKVIKTTLLHGAGG